MFLIKLNKISSETWWLGSRVANHVSNMMHKFLSIKTINTNENFWLMGNQVKAPIVTIGPYNFFLDTNHNLDSLKYFMFL